MATGTDYRAELRDKIDMATLQTLIKGGGGDGNRGGDAEAPLAATIKLKAGKVHEVMVEIDHQSVSVLRWSYQATVRESSPCSLHEHMHTAYNTHLPSLV